ncbi:Calcium/calmodulin-dependent protein kinase 2 [Komagataella phaffii CBS 7435]|uniref:calcium/calmodulin-dependent protein kinase n=2 Tax=Komagataella phaffii TaxID=460519 RepID=C4QY19_KOMPG|nr:Calmodulin-dependent protein kinase [Komagataella phaffii GS115]AOA60776.1 GQ67_01871T0 [Komagataella phaffii]CAH2446962.1 Calcium/calmodulin-dependent protein kinase 2 [Komagataella phaffii CBS 7435]AOA65397.1 GQ68_01886T0 [Komagataella phaffii GS115]CAY68142.1 Calmodulin-dependent protein kinase [Komagataella phaffii GS115]CCA37217.1 Calcium/calmodulin-dependent protein kinase 2 [Komagataella phaffii CBS 7435]
MPYSAPRKDESLVAGFSKIINRIQGQPSSYNKKQDYTFGKTLGAGAFGVVRQARDNATKENYAIKIILKKTLNGNEKMIMDEIAVLSKLHHKHIVGFKDFFESKDKFFLVTQLATGGELFDRIIEKTKFKEADAARVIYQILSATEYIHDKDIVHRDIKPENVLYLTRDEDSPIVLADFGVAKQLRTPDQIIVNQAGSFGYAAPEVLVGVGYGKPCDIWSIGIITYTVLCGFSPVRSESVDNFLEEVTAERWVIFYEQYWKDVSLEARQFIVSMLQIDQNQRPTAKELLKHPWITSNLKEDRGADLLPNLREGFNARSKFKQVIEIVKMQNRLKNLKALNLEDSEEDDLDYHAGTISRSDTTQSQAKTSAFHQLVATALENKERVQSFHRQESQGK